MPTGHDRAQPSLRNFSTRPPPPSASATISSQRAALPANPAASLPRRALRAMQLSWNLQVRSCKPHPFAAHIVHVRENRHNAARLARRFGSPSSRLKMLDQHLVHTFTGGKYLDCSSAERSVNFHLARGHGSLPLTYDTSAPSPFRTNLENQTRNLKARVRVNGPTARTHPEAKQSVRRPGSWLPRVVCVS